MHMFRFLERKFHSSLGAGERYHQPLRATFRKIRLACPKVCKEFLLIMAVKAMNDTLGPKGLLHSALVFGGLPQNHMPAEIPEPRDTISERAGMSRTACD